MNSTFTYAADGLRHRMVSDGATTDYVVDSSMFMRDLRTGLLLAPRCQKGVTSMLARRSNRLMVISAWTACILALTAGGCKNGPPNPPPCYPALQCVDIVAVAGPNCDTIPDQPALLWRLRNRHPSRSINVWLRQTVDHLNTGQPSTITVVHRTPVKPIPDAGLDLGCKYVLIQAPPQPQQYDAYHFEAVQACFTDQDCTPPAPVPPRPPGVDCSRTCSAPYCIKADLRNPGNPVETNIRNQVALAAKHLLNDVPLNSVDITGLLGLAGAVSSQRALQAQSGATYTSDGDTVRASFDFPLQPATSAEMTVPAYILCTIRQQASRSATLVFSRPTEALAVEYFDVNNQSLGSEPVQSITVTQGTVKIMGARAYCVWLIYGDSAPARPSRRKRS